MSSEILSILSANMPPIIVFILILIAAIATIVIVRKKKQSTKFIARLSSALAIVLSLTLVVNILLFGTMQMVLTNYFRPVVSRSDNVTQAVVDLTEEIQSEGIILLRNERNVLPLAEDSRRVNVFGWSSTNPVYGGTGSGAVDTTFATDFFAGLTGAGIEYNQEIVDFYTSYRSNRPVIAIRAQDWTVPQPSLQDYDAAGIFESARAFSDTAIVYIARSGGEGADLATSIMGVSNIELQDLPDGRTVPVGFHGSDYEDDRDPNKHYLELSNREHALMQRVTSEFSNVIVLLNTGNVFELDWVDTYSVDSVAWIGGPGESGFKAVGKMLTGAVNPSGRTVNTWLKDLKQEPTFGNFGHYHYIGSENVSAGEYFPISWSGDPATTQGYQFLNYAEGIYMGYRFFETFFLDNEESYNSTVMYPFGYGLSYTSFQQRMGELRVQGDTISVDVTVTNTGSLPGKETVQLYSTPPYYEGGIEKSHVVLVAFDKTSILAPGESETRTLTLNIEELASYDHRTARAYVLEQGTYELKLMRNAHELIDSKEYVVGSTIIYRENNKRPSDMVAATNQFDFAEGSVTYLSRSNNFENANVALASAVDRSMTPQEEAAVAVDWIVNESDIMPTTGARNGLRLLDMVGKDYDDPQWESLLDQLTVEEMANLIIFGGYNTGPVSSIDKPGTLDIDGPQGLSAFMGAWARSGAYPTAIVIASTWNVELAEARGRMVGTEALELGINGWYAPGINLHRSSFAGRNFEYYSEDAFLSGKIGAAEVKGAEELGLYCYVKHFTLNDQERNRNSRLITWTNEQALREIYLKPFEMAVKEGGATAMMSAFNYIGPVWAGGSHELQNTVLRDEWGFRGMVITDYFGNYGYMYADQAIANGNDLMLSTLGLWGASPDLSQQSATGINHMRIASKNILYTVANSNAMYTVDQRNQLLQEVGGRAVDMGSLARYADEIGSQPWMLVVYGIDAVIGLLIVGTAVFGFLRYKKMTRKENEGELQVEGTGVE